MRLDQLDFRHAYGFCEEVQRAVFNDEADDPDAPGWFLPGEDEVFLRKASSPHRETLLHDYIYEVVTYNADYVTGHGAPEDLVEFRQLLIAAVMTPPSWLTETEVSEHIYELDELVRDAVRRLVPAAFHLLYTDLRFLHQFQRVLATRVQTLKRVDHPGVLRADGVLERPQHWPHWLRIGVYHRDKGRCQECQRDLSGVVLLEEKIHIDHIVPLAHGGTNDPTNLQLLCAACNLAKGTKEAEGNWRTQTFW